MRDIGGTGAHVSAAAAAGTQYYYRQLYSLELRSGHLLGDRFSLDLDSGYEVRPRDAFYGIGNGDASAPPVMVVDPRMDSLSVETRYRQTRVRAALAADERVWSDLHVRAAGAV